MSLVKLFNSQIDEFIYDILKVFPNNKDIKTLKFVFENICKVNPSMSIKLWYKTIMPLYYDNIKNRDYGALFVNDFKSDLKKYYDGNAVIEIVSIIQNLSTKLTDEDKTKIMNYMLNFCKISEKYNEQIQ
jgi:hypothetical protein